MGTEKYEALLAISVHMRAAARPGVQQVYIVLSDGNPEDHIIPVEEQLAKIKRLAQRLQQEGHIVLQVTLGPDVLSRQMYPNCLPFPAEGYPELIRRFGSTLKKLLANHRVS